MRLSLILHRIPKRGVITFRTVLSCPLPTSFPSNFHGYRCFVDAATAPDFNNYSPKFAGLGIFIVNTNVNPPFSVFIKAFMRIPTRC
jgi:hypothetical protein